MFLLKAANIQSQAIQRQSRPMSAIAQKRPNRGDVCQHRRTRGACSLEHCAQRNPVFYRNPRLAYQAIVWSAAISARPDIARMAEMLKPSTDHRPMTAKSAEMTGVIGAAVELTEVYSVRVVMVGSFI